MRRIEFQLHRQLMTKHFVKSQEAMTATTSTALPSQSLEGSSVGVQVVDWWPDRHFWWATVYAARARTRRTLHGVGFVLHDPDSTRRATSRRIRSR